jgi:(p)ppGpp synthase/HD superfamily hydrolase
MSNATVLTDRFDRALLYATHVHGGQVRKGTSTPYVAHLLAVAATVLEYGGDEDLAIAALLHDSVEDQGGRGRLEDVRNRFGERVARIVEACSDSLADTAKGERKAQWLERKKAYLEHLRAADDDILRVFAGRQGSQRPRNSPRPEKIRRRREDLESVQSAQGQDVVVLPQPL